MAEVTQNQRRFIWAPRALAVISCALALLAAQPAGGAAPDLRKGAVVLREGGVAGGELGTRATESREQRQTVRTARLGETLLSSARHWRILATMEILHRLLVGELRGAEQQVMAAVWMDVPCVGAAAPVKVTGRVEAAGGWFPIMEREYAIRHCLLAPPVS
jgi:hypothetical protein